MAFSISTQLWTRRCDVSCHRIANVEEGRIKEGDILNNKQTNTHTHKQTTTNNNYNNKTNKQQNKLSTNQPTNVIKRQ